MSNLAETQRFRRGRNYIGLGDIVRISARPGKRNAFQARVRAIRVNGETGEVAEVEVFGGPSGREMVRTFRPERVERLAQTKAGTLRDRRI